MSSIRKKKTKRENYEYCCLFCNTKRTKLISVHQKKPLFCDSRCSNNWQRENRGPYGIWELRLGKEKALERKNIFLKKLSINSSGENNGMFGRPRTEEDKAKSRNKQLGVSFEQRYGHEIAEQKKRKISKKYSGSGNPAYGKVYSNGGKSVKGYYKGKFFRSLFEYSFMKELEKRGLDIHSDVLYENFLIKYIGKNGNDRTYRPDFFVIKENIVYEVKPKYAVKQDDNIRKFEAAKKFFENKGIFFNVVTEENFQKIEFVEALKDRDIVFKENSLGYFNK